MHKPILQQTPRTSLQVLRDVTFGLLIRELKTRFGSYRLGYAWALIDPLLIIGAFSLIFGLRGHSGFGEAPAPLFITAGYLPFLFQECRDQTAICSQCQHGVVPVTVKSPLLRPSLPALYRSHGRYDGRNYSGTGTALVRF